MDKMLGSAKATRGDSCDGVGKLSLGVCGCGVLGVCGCGVLGVCGCGVLEASVFGVSGVLTCSTGARGMEPRCCGTSRGELREMLMAKGC